MSLLAGNVTVSDGYKATYAEGFAVITLNSGTVAVTDIFGITGSATKTIRILRMGISGTKTVGAALEVLLVKRSSLTTGLTDIGAGSAPRYSLSNPLGTASVLVFIAGTIVVGTLTGIIRSTKLILETTTLPVGTSAAQTEYIWEFKKPGQELVLRGANEAVYINFNGVIITGAQVAVFVEWSEE